MTFLDGEGEVGGVVIWSIVWGGNIAKRRGILDGKGDYGADQEV